jgi:urease accessory protein
MKKTRKPSPSKWKFLTAGLVLLPLQEASAHHMTGGRLPATFGEGLISGLAHPVIGLDHLAFIIAIGLLSLRFSRGLLLPLAFVITGLFGTWLHLRLVNLPGPEILVSSSVVIFGLLLILPSRFPLAGLLALTGLAGVAHGYAYGESIVGAGMVPLGSYLFGFTFIQFAVAWLSRFTARTVFGENGPRLQVAQRFAGFGISALGMVFLITAVRVGVHSFH